MRMIIALALAFTPVLALFLVDELWLELAVFLFKRYFLLAYVSIVLALLLIVPLITKQPRDTYHYFAAAATSFLLAYAIYSY